MMNYFYLLIIFLGLLVLFRKQESDFIKKSIKFNTRGYRIYYQDSASDDDTIIQSRLLESNYYGLVGKPDYILKHKVKNDFIPIELKSGKIGNENRPHEGDFLQLITYFLLIEEEFDVSPKYGKIIYSDYMFIIKNKHKHKKQLLKVVHNMRVMLKTGKNANVEPSFPKCRYCLCNNTVCEVNKSE